MGVITGMLDREEIPLRVTHNDTKLNNIMIDENTKERSASLAWTR